MVGGIVFYKQFLAKFSCTGHNSKTIQGILLKLHIVIMKIERKCSV